MQIGLSRPIPAHGRSAGWKYAFKIGEAGHEFVMMIGTASPHAQRYCAANIFGPNLRNTQKHSKKIDAAHSPSSLKTILNKKGVKDGENVRKYYRKENCNEIQSHKYKAKY